MKFKLLFICLGFIGSVYSMSEANKMLLESAQYGDIKLVQEALDNKADINSLDKDGNTVLMWTARCGHETTVKLLLNKGAKLDIQDGVGDTALMWAVVYGDETTVKLLLEAGASLDLKNFASKTALDLAKIVSIELMIENEPAKREKFRQDVHKEISEKYLLPDLANIVLEYANYPI